MEIYLSLPSSPSFWNTRNHRSYLHLFRKPPTTFINHHFILHVSIIPPCTPHPQSISLYHMTLYISINPTLNISIISPFIPLSSQILYICLRISLSPRALDLCYPISTRILGLRVLGYTGDGDKASWIKTELVWPLLLLFLPMLTVCQGFDWAFNYKTQDLKQTLNIAAPNGVGAK